MDLRLEMLTSSPGGVRRGSIPIERPEGFNDETYLQHANCAAELLRQVMNGEVDYRHRTGDGATVSMIVADETVIEYDVKVAFDLERIRQDRYPNTWGRVHIVELPVAVK
jgi:hypothetical protein